MQLTPFFAPRPRPRPRLLQDSQTSFGTALVACLLDRQPESAVVALCTGPPCAERALELAAISSKAGKDRLAVIDTPTTEAAMLAAAGEVGFVKQYGVDVLVLGAATGLDVCSSCDTAANLCVRLSTTPPSAQDAR